MSSNQNSRHILSQCDSTGHIPYIANDHDLEFSGLGTILHIIAAIIQLWHAFADMTKYVLALNHLAIELL
jgi:hypothetical protein